MRVWDVNPGYLNDASLLGEHREVHAILSIVLNRKKGYSRHPETLRWEQSPGALLIRHQLLVSEMQLRGFSHKSPAPVLPVSRWPGRYIDPPWRQYEMLRAKYRGRRKGRIPLPADARQLWAQHEYSVLARDPVLYRRIGREASGDVPAGYFAVLAGMLAETLSGNPGPGNLGNALDHMWGCVSSPEDVQRFDRTDPGQLIREIRIRAKERNIRYLMESTALCDLDAHITLADKE